MDKQELQQFVDRCASGDLTKQNGWDFDAIAGSLLARGYPEAECARIAAYVEADRETLIIKMLLESWPGFEYGPPVKGYTWDLYPKHIPFFVGNLAREVHFPSDD